MEMVDRKTYVVTKSRSGRRYVIRRRSTAYRGTWDVCGAEGGVYGMFATLPGARSWARRH